MDNYKLIIKDKDLFDLFFNKVPYIWQALDFSVRKDPKREPICLYKESVKVVRAVDKFMDDLRAGNLPWAAQLGMRVTGHAEFDGTYLTYFNELKFERGMFDMAYLQLGLNWAYYQKFLQEDAANQPGRFPHIEEIWTNSSDSPKLKRQWSPSEFQYEKAWRLTNFFTELQRNPLYIEERDKQTRLVEETINDVFAHFDRLLSIHEEVYIFVIDVRFISIFNQADNKPLEHLIEQVLKDRPTIQNAIFQVIPDFLHAYTKLEHDYQNGLKLSCILILRSHAIEQEEDIIARLLALLKNDFRNYDDIDVINGNEFVRTHGSKSAVGRVGTKTPTRVEKFKYWVLSYFIKMDFFAKLINPQIPFEVNEIIEHPKWQQLEVKKQVMSSKKSPSPKNFAQVLQDWKTPKGIWDVKHLPKRVADRLLVGQIYYKEFCAEQGSSKHCGDLLFQIEVFIETFLHNRYPAFNEMRSAHQSHFFNARDIQASATQVGQQYLSLVQQVTSDPSLLGQIDDLIQNCGLRTWWFGQEYNLTLWVHLQQIFKGIMLNQPIDVAALAQWNRNLQYVQHNLFSIRAQDKDKRELLEKHYSQCARRHIDTIEYLKGVLEQNSWAYRIVIDARSLKGSFKQSELSKLFTEFMRLAKRAKPCYWLRGYVGIWQENSGQVVPEFKLDVVLLFNDRCQEQLKTVVYDLDQRWNDFLNAKAAQILKRQDPENIKYDGAVKPKILMHSIDALNTEIDAPNTYHVCLEAYDRQMKKMVIEHVIPYFTYRDVFQAPLSQKVAKAFIKGSMLKK
ncbi:hypothetical protein [Acinetobacter calcoaceticus]|uniref:hypothetical protein n=1 Tax=Acinetobacter calcoaceticus TaxID=471 RepID=UPI0028558CE0|nr:hypothetical protein [Acinetobacter calcoaceticus]MDR6798346.1 hypothetical protein [Acinetobacter calcoaceticus]